MTSQGNPTDFASPKKQLNTKFFGSLRPRRHYCIIYFITIKEPLKKPARGDRKLTKVLLTAQLLSRFSQTFRMHRYQGVLDYLYLG